MSLLLQAGVSMRVVRVHICCNLKKKNEFKFKEILKIIKRVMSEEKANIRCNKCKCYRYPSEFINDKGRELKTCKKCRINSAKSRERNKCPHGRQRNACKECNGGSICEHGRQRSKCKECVGSQICEQNRQRSQCKKCNGSSICEHGRRRSQCKECDGSSICEHNRLRNTCKECNGTQICEHNRKRNTCKDCMNHEQKLEYIQKTMILTSRNSDKKFNRYDADHFIDKCFLEGLFEDSQNCHYCGVEFTYNEKIDTFVTIERLNNSIGHIKSNCVLACWYCNCRHTSHNESDDEKSE